MTVSRADAISLLRKWQDESTPVGLITKFEGVISTLNGLVKIDAGNPDFFLVELRADHRWKAARTTVPLHGSPQFDFSDTRQAPQAIRKQGFILSGLRLDWPTLRVVIFELNRRDSGDIPAEEAVYE